MLKPSDSCCVASSKACADILRLNATMEKLQSCDTLEEIADSLSEVDRRKCLGIANAIVPLLRSIHQYEERVIFPAYEVALDGSMPILPQAGDCAPNS